MPTTIFNLTPNHKYSPYWQPVRRGFVPPEVDSALAAVRAQIEATQEQEQKG